MARRTAAQTRAEILARAAELFRDGGYSQTSVRDIAAAARTDPALVIRHFGSKEALFVEAAGAEGLAEPLFGGPLETMGRDVVRALLATEEAVRSVVLALVRASDGSDVAERLRGLHETEFVRPLRARLTGPDADLRASLAAALVGGLVYSLWIVVDERLLAAEDDDVVARYGALLQALIDPGTKS